MNTLPHGVIRVCIRGRIRIFLMRDVQWAPAFIVLGPDAETYTIPARNYQQATPDEAARFWSQLEQAVYERHTNTRN